MPSRVKGARFRCASTSDNSNLVGNGFIRSVLVIVRARNPPTALRRSPSFDKEGYGAARDAGFIKK